MGDSSWSQGGCACGAIRYRVEGELRDVTNCHCEPCRRITGHFMAATAAPRDSLVIDSTTTLRWYDRTDSVRYGFCGTCGSTLFWRAADKPDRTSIAAGTLDVPTGLRTTLALFCSEASDYHDLDPDLDSEPRDRSLGLADG